MMHQWDDEVEVLVVGAGGCGLVAALAAHESGAQVRIFEKMQVVGGTTRLSAGSIPGAGTRFQREAGIEDSPEGYYADLLRQSGPHEMEALAKVLAKESAPLVEWLVDSIGLELRLITDFRHVGHSVNRLHAPPTRTGAELIAGLEQAARARSIPIQLGCACLDLITGEQGEVLGAVFDVPGVGRRRYGARSVILASGGFAGNPELVSRFTPEIAGAAFFGPPGITGEAVIWGERLGAWLANIAAYNGYAVHVAPNGPALTWTIVEKGGLAVNQHGRRFGNELVGYSGFAAEVLAQNGPVHILFDARLRDTVARHEKKFQELLDAEVVREFPSLEALAEACQIELAGLAETIQSYNNAAAGKAQDAYGRSSFGLAPLEPPWAVCPVVAGLNATQGGLAVDDYARVIREDGTVVWGLFAGGGAAAGVSGHRGGRGYSSGNGLLGALVLGRIAGRTAAQLAAVTPA